MVGLLLWEALRWVMVVDGDFSSYAGGYGEVAVVSEVDLAVWWSWKGVLKRLNYAMGRRCARDGCDT